MADYRLRPIDPLPLRPLMARTRSAPTITRDVSRGIWRMGSDAPESMKLASLTFAILLAMLAVVAGAVFVGVPEGPEGPVPVTGAAHPTISTMLVGGDGEAKHERVFALGVAFGVLEIVFFSVCLALGVARKGEVGKLAGPIAVGAALHVATFLAMIVTYRHYRTDADPGLFLGLPVPTAWMMYGLWWVPMVFIVLYIAAFDRHVFSEDDLKRFNEILDKRDRREGIDA